MSKIKEIFFDCYRVFMPPIIVGAIIGCVVTILFGFVCWIIG